ncbi:MAG: SDR family oxidoreductase, partial [Deltaproteobacteria bacterium]|nr:SDR family oxidoreductase [Deltaproteobacteria bacterium]
AKEAIEKIQGNGIQALPVEADMSKDEEVARMVAKVAEQFGTIDVLVNAAAVQIYPGKEISQLEPREWDFVLNIGLKAAYLSTRHVVPIFKSKGGGKIVNIASIAGHRGSPGGSAYTAAKGGVITLTRQMAVELGPHHINVNSVSPGFTPNRLTTVYEYQAMAGGTDQPPIPSTGTSAMTPPPLGRKGNVDDFVGPVLFLASRWADFITGIDLPVEGGRLAAR